MVVLHIAFLDFATFATFTTEPANTCLFLQIWRFLHENSVYAKSSSYRLEHV